MTSTHRKRWMLASMLASGCLWMTGAAAAQDPPKPDKPADPAAAPADTGGKVTYNGLLDWYYQYSFNHPPAGANLAGRAFDVKNDQFAFSLAEVNVTRTASKSFPIGLTITGTIGKTADLVHATEPGTKTIRFLQQVYGTYQLGGKKPLTIDVGKFVTMMGYEVIESSSNDNYSRSLLFNYAIPFYHMGARLTYPFTSTLTGQLHIVNGWNNVEDDNGAKSIGAQLAWNPNAAWSWILNWMGGNEFTGAGLPVDLNVQTLDLVGIWKPTAKLKLGANVDYATTSSKTVPLGEGSATFGGHWSGEAIYARYQFTPAVAAALRAEHFEDSNGLRSGVAQNLNEITATLEHVWRGNLVTRLEFRHDHAGTAFFPSKGGGSNDQDTITFAQVVKF